MAEYNKQRFFWIKLSDRFMTSDAVDYIMSQKDGANYIVIYQMLCLKTVNNDGCLSRTLGEIIVPYDEEKIQRDLKWFSIDTIRVAIHLYRQLGLVYEQDNGILRIADFDNMVGSQTISAEKKKEQRNSRKNALKIEGGQKVDKCPPDIEIEKDKDISHESHACACEERTGNGALTAFLQAHPTIKNELTSEIPLNIDWAALGRAIAESEWLQQCTSLRWLIDNYDKIISGIYKTFKAGKTQHFEAERKYTAEELDGLYKNVDDIDF